ncbi:AMP-binding protein [Rubricoccus marinus]|uniref:O-succinylbenzoate--CoA ligase n=1 Tax=Rubricoccus marinus TaxID=716817 RepID=A0A259TZQ2_9BACT|nr:AMP-binding protein [Rubricoccus marinus]OZC03077.1 hypothetical protein BSZ36_08895 [Rubricoccus marinus]
MTDPASAHALRQPLAPAVVGREAVAWGEWNARIGRAARGLTMLGVDRVALRCTDRLSLAVLALGAIRAGVLAVLVPTRWPAPLAESALANAGVEVAVTDLPLATLKNLAPEAILATQGENRGGSLDADRPAVAVFTSGSTGAPKAAVLTWGALEASARGVNSHLGLEAGDRWLLDLPVAHVGGLGVVVRCALAGAALAVPSPGQPLADALAALAPTHASLVSTQLRRLLASGANLDSLRAILLGGSAMPDALLAEAVARGLPVSPSYGLTEMGSTVTAVSVPATPEALATSGRPLAGREVRISASGEIEVRDATRFSGYLTPDGLIEPFQASGWFATGDLGDIDGAGRLCVSGRRGLRFVSGGENVQPEAIERELLALGAVAEAVVVPIEDAEFGHRPLAFVRPAAGESADSDAIRAALRQRLPGFMIPVEVVPWEGAQGMKPDRVALAEAARQKRNA